MTQTTLESELKWHLRVSPRARYAKLQIKPYGGLEVVIPPRFPRAQIPLLVAKHRHWVTQQLDRQARLRKAVRLPRQLELAFDESVIPIFYPNDAPPPELDLGVELRSAPLVINTNQRQLQVRQLRDFIRHRARAQLPQRLLRISQQTGLDYSRVSIRSQKTRWGSCSSRGHISLNDQLLFLPGAIVDYLMIHELCHTRHLNHSNKYWRLVESHCPEYRTHEKQLKGSRDWVPDWFLLDLYR